VVLAGPRALEGLLAFGTRWVKNASLFSLVRWPFLGLDQAPASLPLPRLGGWQPPPLLLDSLLAAKLVLVPMACLALFFLARWPDQEDEAALEKAHLALALLLVASPVGNPWYLGWVLPLAALRGSLAWPLVAGGAIGYYAYHFEGGYLFAAAWVPGGSLDVRWLEYLPGYGMLVLELWRCEAGVRASRMAASLSSAASRSSLSTG
jgi:hypothetical protein